MQKKLSWLFILFVVNSACWNSFLTAQQICGIVLDKTTGEPLIGASVYSPSDGKGTSTDNNGYFCLPTAKNISAEIQVSYIGYEPANIYISENKNDSLLEISLKPGLTLTEVKIVKQVSNGKAPGLLEIPVELMAKLPGISGEADLMKMYQMMPGVKMGDEGTSVFYVRGGTPDQNLTLLDDLPLYYVNHLGGFLSVFDVNTIKKATLYKGYSPARFAGRLSSVLDVRLKNGDTKEVRRQVMIGTLASKFFIEGPVIENKLSGMFSIRRCNLDLFMRPLSAMASNRKDITAYTFYDVTSKATYSVNPSNKLKFVFYSGRDKIYFKENDAGYLSHVKNRWGNVAGSVKWNRFTTNNTVFTSGINFTKFYRIFTGEETIESGKSKYRAKGVFKSNIEDYQLFTRIKRSIQKVDLNAGAEVTRHTFTPTAIKSFEENSVENSDVAFTNQLKTSEIRVFIETGWRPDEKLTFSGGISGTYWNKMNYRTIDPRLSVNYEIAHKIVLNTSFSVNHQYVHLLSNNSGGFPVDLWIPSSKKIIPEKSQEFSVAIMKTMDGISFSIEGYYKEMENLIFYKPGFNIFNTTQWENAIETQGEGISRGIEVLVQKNTGKNSGWLGYTLSKDTRIFDKLNNGKSFPFKYGRLHEVNLVYSREISKKISFSANWIYASGNFITLAIQSFPAIDYTNNNYSAQNYFETKFVEAHHYGGINNFKTESYHRLDIGLHFKKQLQKSERTFYIGAYNLYNRKNPYYYYFNGNKGNKNLIKYSLFPVIPSVSFTWKW